MDEPAVVSHLDATQCWGLLAQQDLGRLVTNAGGVLDIFPVNFVVDGRTLVFRTAEGSKLTELTVSDEVLFEVDDHTAGDAWSVVVRGHARRLTGAGEIEAADRLPLRPWLPTEKHNYVRITPRTLSGRSFDRGEEPDRYGAHAY